MALLVKSDIIRRLGATGEDKITIRPLLDEEQIGEMSVDLRLGTDFAVSILTRRPVISTVSTDTDFRAISSYFRVTRRELGDRFILYPHQVVISTTLEYVGLPADIYADILTRSSFNRLGITINTMLQPGFRGCAPLELVNHGNNPIELVVGGRFVQARLLLVSEKSNYPSTGNRKYFGNIRPTLSSISDDADIPLLEKVRERR